MLFNLKIDSERKQPLGSVNTYPAPNMMYDADTPQPFTWKAASLFVVTGVGLYFYFESEKAKVTERRSESPSPRLTPFRAYGQRLMNSL